jgi:signal transduction histidine kinase
MSKTEDRELVVQQTAIDEFILPVMNFTIGGRLRSANKAAASHFGLNQEALPQKDFFSLFYSEIYTWETILQILNQQSQPELVLGTSVDEVMTGESIVRLGWIRIGGEPIVQAVLLRNGIGVPKVSNLKNEALEYLSILAAGGFVLAFNKNFEYVFARGEFNGTGLTKKKVLGRHFSAIFSPAKSGTLYTAHLRAMAGQSTTVEEPIGKDKWFKWYIGPFTDKTSEAVGLVVATSIDEFKHGELELVRQLEDQKEKINQLKVENGVRKLIERNMQEQKHELELKNQELEQFAYVASHDLQEPLRMVSSYTQLLGKRYGDKLDPEANEFIGYAVEGATRMQSLITDLLSYSRVGRKEMSFERINLDVIIQVVKRNLSVLIEETGAEIIVEKSPLVLADAQQLIQLFQNLISNAIKFVKPGVKPEIRISARAQGKYWRICVQDNGIGFNMEYKDRIFQIFQRLHGRDKYAGTGIGLAICKKIVERHGGQIWAESELDMGTKFFFTLAR